jgi:hypothetical protein
MTSMTQKRLRLVVFQEKPGLWLVEASNTIRVQKRARSARPIRVRMQFVQAHTAFDVRHDHLSLAAFPPAAQEYWNAYPTGTPISLAQLGITSPDWHIRSCVRHAVPRRRAALRVEHDLPRPGRTLQALRLRIRKSAASVKAVAVDASAPPPFTSSCTGAWASLS